MIFIFKAVVYKSTYSLL